MPAVVNADNSGNCGENVTYYYSEESHTLTISGTGPMADYENETFVPWYIYKYNINDVIVNNGVTSIGDMAFHTCSFSSISIPESVTSIGKGAFCLSQLSSISLPNGLKKIGDQAFYSSKLTSIIIPQSVTSIGNLVFGHNKLESIIVEEGNSVYDSRNNCNAIIETASNILLLGCYCTIIPEDVKIIGDYAFNGCVGLWRITIPNNVTSIGKGAFSGCSGFTSVTIPQSVVSIGNNAFSGCVFRVL